MLKNTLAVKLRQAVGIGGKMGGNPVQNNAHACLVELIHQIHKILGLPVPGCGSVISCHLIPPGSVEGVLQNAHQLHMGILHLLQIFHKPVCKKAVIVEAFFSVGMFHKGAHMALIDCHGFFFHVLPVPGLHPLPVLPDKAVQIRGDGSRSRSVLCKVGKGIRLVELPSVLGSDQEFIHFARTHSGDKLSPDSHRPQFFHGMCALVPAVETADHMHLAGVGRPHAEKHTLLPVLTGQVCAKFLVDIIVGRLGEEVLVSLRNENLLHLTFHVHTAFHATKSFSVKIIISSSSYLLASSISRKCPRVFLLA